VTHEPFAPVVDDVETQVLQIFCLDHVFDKKMERDHHPSIADQEESVEDEHVPFVNIEELQNHGINAGDIKKLKVELNFDSHFIYVLACWNPYSDWRFEYQLTLLR
jgi:hypothetical protein